MDVVKVPYWLIKPKSWSWGCTMYSYCSHCSAAGLWIVCARDRASLCTWCESKFIAGIHPTVVGISCFIESHRADMHGQIFKCWHGMYCQGNLSRLGKSQSHLSGAIRPSVAELFVPSMRSVNWLIYDVSGIIVACQEVNSLSKISCRSLFNERTGSISGIRS